MVKLLKTVDARAANSKSILYIDMFYPYDYTGETFLATEIDSTENFKEDNINKFIFPIWSDRKKDKIVELDGFKVVDNIPNYSKIRKLIWCLFTFIDAELYKEIFHLSKSKRLNYKNVLKLIGFLGQGNYLSSQLKKYICKNIPRDTEIIFYAYWLHLQAYVAVKVSKKLSTRYHIKSISRCHRFDVYEYAANGYIPLRDYILNGLNMIYPISQDAMDYIITSYGINKSKLRIRRLGTIDNGLKISSKGSCLKILSCSWMRPVKRNKLILDALKELKFDVEWTHIGDGEEFEGLKREIKKLPNSNIKCRLLGKMDNKEVIDYYKTNDFNIFVNVSVSEGVPVSIMEAMAFGKLIIATNVGGTKEVLRSGKNGFLMPVELSPKQLAQKFQIVYEMNEHKYKEMCQESRKIWEELCDAKTNYNIFNRELLK
ncbi:glycosyltransferase [Priestia megaterium]